MDEQRLLKLALIGSCFGLFTLFGLFMLIEIPEYEINDLLGMADNTPVRVFGTVHDVHETDKVVRFNLGVQRWEEAEAIHFKRSSEQLGIASGDVVHVYGQWYDERIIVERVEVSENSRKDQASLECP